MPGLRRFLARLATLVTGRARERDLDDELTFHLEEEAAERIADGLPRHDAERAARRSLGNVSLLREDARAEWTWGPVERLLQDTRYAIRVLLRERSFAATALLTIVLLVGGSTSVFTLVNSVLLRPLPYPESGRIAFVETVGNERPSPLTYDEAYRLRSATTSFEAWGLYRPGYVVTLDRTSEDPLEVQDMRITPELFPLLGIRMALGRPLVADDELDSSPDVGVISHDLWQKRFGGAEDVIGKTFVWRNDRTLTVVGVTAPGADVPTNWLKYPIVWNPIRESQRTGQSVRFTVLARLKADRTLRMANRELGGLGNRGSLETRPSATGLLHHVVGDTQRVLWVLVAAVAVVLFIGITNLASLQHARNGKRERELAVRLALGAGRWRLVRQLATESLLLGLAGGTCGFFAAQVVVAYVSTTLPPRFPRVDQISIDTQVLIFAIAVSMLVAVAIGILPAWRVVRPGLAQRVNEGATASTLSYRRARVQRVLIGFETGAALVLLVGAGLLVNSFGRLFSQNAGMQEGNLWTVTATLPLRYQSPRDADYWTNALRLIRDLPEVERAALTVNDSGPLGGGDRLLAGLMPAGSRGTSERFALSHRNVGAGYFETLGIPIIAGRPILETDLAGGVTVAVINQFAASTMWPGESAIGKHFGSGDWRFTVVGIVPDFKLNRLDGDVSMQMYVPYTQRGEFAGTSAILVRARSDAPVIGDRLRTTLLNLEKDLTFVQASTMAQVRWRLLAAERFRTTVLAIFALTATFLSLVGVFGLVAYTVGQRTREIGLRVALGSSYGRVAGLMVRQALVPAAIGIAAGGAAAFAASRVLRTFLFGIEPTDPATFVSAIGLFVLASAAAAFIPALRAFRVQPANALRHE